MFSVNAIKTLDLDSFITDKDIYDGPETLLRLARKGARMKEVPIMFCERRAGESKLTIGKILKNLVNNFKLRLLIGGA